MTGSATAVDLGPATVSAGRWTRADIFRAAMFGALAVLYAVLMFPLAVVTLSFWVIGKVLDRSAPRPLKSDSAS